MVAFLLLCVFSVIVALVLAFARLSVLSTRLRDLDTNLRGALGRLEEFERKFRAVDRVTETKKKTVRSLRKRPSPAQTRIVAPPSGVAPSLTPAPAVPLRPVPAGPPPAKSRTKEEWEALIGGKLLNRIGALALILGVGFFLEYAFTNDWITEPVRVMIGVVIGLALLAGAARSAARGFQIFAQGLVGAGIAILYLSVYASFNYYHIVPRTFAFVFMSAVTVITFTQAFRYDSIVVALLGLLGGFLTPFLLSTGEVNPAGLFSYIALLNLGLLVVAWRRESWMSIEPLSMAGTYVIYALWLSEQYAETYFVPGLLFLALFWLMFHALHVLRIERNVTSFPRFRVMLASLHGAVAYVLLYILIDNGHPDWRVPATLVLAILYGATSIAARRRAGQDRTFLQPALTAIGLIVIATCIQFKGMALVQYWTVESLALVWAGTQWRLRSVWGGGLLLFVASFLLLLGTAGALVSSPAEPFTLLFNARAFTFLLLATCIALGTVILGRAAEYINAGVRTVLHIAWCWILFILITAETLDLFAQIIRNGGAAQQQHLEYLRMIVLPPVWGAYALALVLGGARSNLRPIVVSGLIVFLAGLCVALVRGLTYVPIGEFTSLLNERVFWLLVLVAELVLARRVLLSRRETAPAGGIIGAGIQAGIVLVFLVVITGETWDYFARGIYRLALLAGAVNIAEEMSRLQNLRQLFLSAAWLGFSIILMGIGIWRRARVVRMEAIVLFGVSILKIFIYDLSFLDTLYRIFSFVGLGVILLAVSYLYQRHREIILGSE